MVEFIRKKDSKTEVTEINTVPVPVPFALGEIKQNIPVKTNKINKPSKEQIVEKAFKFHSNGEIAEATKYYQHFINQGFEDHRVFSNYGVLLKGLDNLKDAELFTRKAIELKPDFSNAHCNLGNILKDLGHLKEAEASTRKAIELKPDFADAHCNLGNILKDLGNLKEAEASTRKAIELKPDFADAHYNLGNILKDLGNIDEALLCYEAAINIDQTIEYALEGIGQMLLAKGNHSEGLIKLREAIGSIGFNPNNSSITIN